MSNNLLKLLAVALFFAAANISHAQAGDYSFSISNSTYTPVGAGAVAVPGVKADDAVATVPIGFTFYFEGAPYTNAVVSSNGFLSFKAGAGSAYQNDLSAGGAANRPLVAPLWDDLDGGVTASAASYELTGTAPNRVFTMQWSNWEWDYQASAAVVSFQVKLFEGTNKVEFHYNNLAPASINSPSASIGLSGATSYLSVYDTSTVTAPVVSKVSEYKNNASVTTGRVFNFLPPTCLAPTNGLFTFAGGDSVVFAWSSQSTGPFNLDFGPAGFTQGTSSTNMSTTSNTSFGVGNLMPGTTYDFYVRLDCGAGTYSSWAGPFTVTTAFTPPYLEDFANVYPNTGYSEGKGRANNPTVFTSASSFWGASSSTNVPGGNKAYINLYSTGRFEWFFSPAIDLGTGTTYQLEFDLSLTAYASTNSATLGPDDTLRVVISTNNGVSWSKSNTLLTLTSANAIPNGAGNHYVINLGAYSGPVRFGFYAQSTASNADNDIYVDNIQVRQPPACPDPQGLVRVYTGTDSIAVAWDSVTTTSRIEYGVAGFTPNTGAGTFVTVTDTFAGVGNLAPNTAYDFYLTSDCSGAGGGLSTTIGPLNVRTLCLPVSAPYIEDFETTSANRDCWSNEYVTGSTDWTFATGSSGGSITTAQSGTDNARFSSTSSLKVTRFVSPLIDVTALNTPYLTFWYGQEEWFGDQNELIVYARAAGSSTWTQVFSDNTNQAAWKLAEVLLPSLGNTIQIAFEGYDKYGRANVLDMVSVVEAPACPDASSLRALVTSDSSAVLSWNASGNGTSFGVWFGPAGFRQSTTTTSGGNQVIAYNDTLVLDTLRSNQCYDYFVKTYCAASNDSTAWIGPFTFCTPCTPFNAPYYQDFNSFPPSCWIEGNGSEPWVGYTGPSGRHLEASFYAYNGDSMVINSPIVNLSGNSQVRLYWSHAYDATYPDDQLIVRARLSNSTVWDTLLNLQGPTFTAPGAGNGTPGTFIEEVMPLDPAKYNGNAVVVELRGNSDWGPDLFIDDFFIEAIPTCFTPINLAASNPTINSVDFTWAPNAQSTGNTFQLSYGPSLSNPALGTKVIVTGTSYTAANLSSSTDYCAFVREICGPNDTSAWSFSPACAATLCGGVVTVPYREGFDGASANCWTNEFVTGTKNWTFNAGSSGGAITAPHSGTRNARFTSSSGGPFTTKLVSPVIDASSLTVTQVSFWYGQEEWFGDQNILSVYYRNGANDPWVYLWSDSSNVAVWDSAAVVIPSTSATLQIAFEGVDLFGRANVVDDVLVGSAGACPKPVGLSATVMACDSVQLDFTSFSGGSIVAYVPTGGSPTSGMLTGVVQSPYVLKGLAPGTAYDVYVADTCGGDTSNFEGPVSFTTSTFLAVTANFTFTQTGATLTNGTVSFDATSSTNGSTYLWRFDNGLTGIGSQAVTNYPANGTYDVTLVVTGACGIMDSITKQVIVQGVSVEENVFNAEVQVYPNPSQGVFTINVGNTTELFNVQITDLSGRSIYRAHDLEPNKDHSVQILEEAAGMYILKITGEGLRVNQRIMLNK
jgi:hypothetical protein